MAEVIRPGWTTLAKGILGSWVPQLAVEIGWGELGQHSSQGGMEGALPFPRSAHPLPSPATPTTPCLGAGFPKWVRCLDADVPYVFGDFKTKEDKKYIEIMDPENNFTIMNEYLEEYNSTK